MPYLSLNRHDEFSVDLGSNILQTSNKKATLEAQLLMRLLVLLFHIRLLLWYIISQEFLLFVEFEKSHESHLVIF